MATKLAFVDEELACCGYGQWSGNPNEPPECCGDPDVVWVERSAPPTADELAAFLHNDPDFAFAVVSQLRFLGPWEQMDGYSSDVFVRRVVGHPDEIVAKVGFRMIGQPGWSWMLAADGFCRDTIRHPTKEDAMRLCDTELVGLGHKLVQRCL